MDRARLDAVEDRGLTSQARSAQPITIDLHPRRRREVEVDEVVAAAKARVDRDAEQPALAASGNGDPRQRLTTQATVAREQPHAARAFGHQRAAIRQEGDLPWNLETGGDGADARTVA
jgi:hypothetical protein